MYSQLLNNPPRRCMGFPLQSASNLAFSKLASRSPEGPRGGERAPQGVPEGIPRGSRGGPPGVPGGGGGSGTPQGAPRGCPRRALGASGGVTRGEALQYVIKWVGGSPLDNSCARASMALRRRMQSQSTWGVLGLLGPKRAMGLPGPWVFPGGPEPLGTIREH